MKTLYWNVVTDIKTIFYPGTSNGYRNKSEYTLGIKMCDTVVKGMSTVRLDLIQRAASVS